MPELPEVETTKRGITPHIKGKKIISAIVRNARFRYRVADNFAEDVKGKVITAIERRAKYLLLQSKQGVLIIHLGMSGSLRVVDKKSPPEKHDHIDINFQGGACLRLRDPRRFGLMLWVTGCLKSHPLIAHLGPEPLGEMAEDYLFQVSRRRTVAVKNLIMSNRVIVGVGNIYANEALYRAGINPRRASSSISKKRYKKLLKSIQAILEKAIEQGGTTLRDFVTGEGEPGYFSQQLKVYGQEGKPCEACGGIIKKIQQSQRATYYCSRCQK